MLLAVEPSRASSLAEPGVGGGTTKGGKLIEVSGSNQAQHMRIGARARSSGTPPGKPPCRVITLHQSSTGAVNFEGGCGQQQAKEAKTLADAKTKAAVAKAIEAKAAEALAAEAKAAEAKIVEAEVNTAVVKAAGSKAAEAKVAEAKAVEAKAAVAKAAKGRGLQRQKLQRRMLQRPRMQDQRLKPGQTSTWDREGRLPQSHNRWSCKGWGRKTAM